FAVAADFAGLKTEIETREKGNADAVRLFYLATLPEHFEAASRNLTASGLVEKGNPRHRIVYEKPFGADLASAKRINDVLAKILDEKNIYRADHYLGKELVANIALIRFTNRILEPLWSRRDIDSVQIILNENFGIKNRGAYYDRYGAVKDMLQSHALQVLSLLAMESPDRLTGEHIRMEKAKVLQKTKVTDLFLGQYDGYLNEANVKPGSKTETFFAARLVVNNSRWNGVPFFLRAGKNLAEKKTVFHIRFKPVECLLAKTCPSDNNYLTIRIEPDGGFGFEINSKSESGDFEIETIGLDYSHAEHGAKGKDAYAVLIYQALLGEQSFFICRDEIEYSWKIVDAFRKDGLPVFSYAAGSDGPKELAAWNEKNNLFWKS
ncbi:glucose-6-phosphate dehydrogenase (NADP(+)), partial [Patescibacteria group bacterium]|nr:glucose-6-phosphate dehydrogenase (NADP(+)) [Patescibacteria group bacterium]